MNRMARLKHPMIERRTSTDRRCRPAPGEVATLARAIAQGEIEILLQPQYACEDGTVVGAEALVRWQHPDHGMLAGDRVFTLAQQAGLATDLARHVHGVAMQAAAHWPEHVRLSLNATAVDLADAGFPALLQSCLAETGLPPARLTLEITEQALIDGLESAARMLSALTDRGIAIALDDFGAGFCNFRYLKVLPLAALKLDRSMVEGIATDRRDLAVFRAIMAMARALDLRVIAEGIETEAQRAAVCREGCDRWQGFLGAAPLTTAAFAELIAG